nr:trans-resveratrol di-O-methyltransferase-like [Ipomoea batatas]
MEGNSRGGDQPDAIEMFEAQVHILKHAYNYINSMVLAAAIQLNIPDFNNVFNEAMASDSQMMRLVAKDCGQVFEEKDNKADITEVKLMFDILMMVLVTGKERTEKEWEKLFIESGFTHYKITPIFGLRSIIEVFP